MGNDKNQNELKKVKEIIELMIENDLVEVEIADGDSKIHLKRPGHSAPAILPAAAAYTPAPVAAEPTAPEEDPNLTNIDSPMVGTFYSAASPDSPAYVKPGDSVTADTVVCIVEAMKVMNEIKAEVDGTIEKVLVSNGQAVEFGQTLFKVRPL
ncbi:MAG: acetyl-CoA carboxylase biotin carboxyl carrier protein [Anaerohalosphaeraceae bacterium]|nr:acetyl-CoA carboxylase biotin carboxyl carrier protein [Anaerohalosphaeraceae bacterium]